MKNLTAHLSLMLILNFPFYANAAGGISCLEDFRSEGGPFQEVKLIQQGSKFDLAIKVIPPGQTTATVDKTVVRGIECKISAGTAPIAFCFKKGPRNNPNSNENDSENENDTYVLFKKVDETRLTSLTNGEITTESFIEINAQAPGIEEENGAFTFGLAACKKN